MSNINFETSLTVAADNGLPPGAVSNLNGATKRGNEKSDRVPKEKAGTDSSDGKDNHSAKRQKQEEEDFVDLICPITREFPFDPVTAEDGHVYEKTAIQSFFETKPGDKIPSPMTQVQMGKTLLPAPKMKNHIESMVMNGYIQGPLADKWKELFVTKTTVDAIMEKALKKQRLSPVQMKMLGEWCVKGSLELGIKKDFPMALQMFQTLHAMGDPEGTAFLGRMFYKGLGTTADVQKGLVYLGMARAQGSSLGAYYLAECFARPKFGLPVDVAEALFCYKLSLRFIQRGENFRRGLTPQEVNKARKRIAELVPLASSTSD